MFLGNVEKKPFTASPAIEVGCWNNLNMSRKSINSILYFMYMYVNMFICLATLVVLKEKVNGKLNWDHTTVDHSGISQTWVHLMPSNCDDRSWLLWRGER